MHDASSIISGNSTVPISGIYIDNGSSGFEVDQNILWNNQHINVNVNGLSNNGPINNYIHNNSIPSSRSDSQISIGNISNCTGTQIVNNRVLVAVDILATAESCVVSGNTSSAPGATEMTPATGVGCNFEGCSSNPPPAIIGGNVTSCPFTGDTP
jgi:hypothetical protein